MQRPAEMVEYYARRAREYERIYERPERQTDLGTMCAAIEADFVGRRVLDIACGTGYFSAYAARRAELLTGFDANEETLEIARAKGIGNAQFKVGDAYALPMPPARYDGALTTFWWSHIPKHRIDEFLRGVQRQIEPGSRVFIADNTYVEGNSTPISRVDESGNSYQSRTLENGARYEVLKNFPTHAELAAWGARFGTEVEVRFLTYFWMLRYRSQ